MSSSKFQVWPKIAYNPIKVKVVGYDDYGRAVYAPAEDLCGVVRYMQRKPVWIEFKVKPISRPRHKNIKKARRQL